MPGAWPLLLAFAPLALVLAALPHNLLALRGAPARPAALRRAASLGAILPGLAAVAVVLTAPERRPAGHRSPDGRLAVPVFSQAAPGQGEVVRVLADPGTPAARPVFSQYGDVPLRFLRWRDDATAEPEASPHAAEGPRRRLLTCGAETCRLREVPEPPCWRP